MQGLSILKELFDNLIGTGIVNEISHSVTIRMQQDTRQPSAPIGGRFQYVGPNDTKGFSCYCRANGPMVVTREERIGSCEAKEYSVTIPHRLVFFKYKETRNHDEISGRLLGAVIKSPSVRLQSMNTIADQILSQETTGSFSFLPETYYAAIDFLLLLKLQGDNCEFEFSCDSLKNPYCIFTDRTQQPGGR